MFLKKIKLKSDFSKNVLTLMIGTGISQIIPILISPILTRLYSPEFFGVFSLFVAITTTLSGVANGRYDVAIVLPDNKSESYNLFILGILISIVFSILLFLCVIFFSTNITSILRNDSIEYWLYFTPISVFLMSLFSLLNYFNTREKKYSDIRDANIVRSITMVGIQVFVGLIKPGAGGLIVGQIISQISSIKKLLKNIDFKFTKIISYNNIKSVAVKYKDYPLYATWSNLLNAASIHVPVIMLVSYYGLTVAGLYSLALRVVGSPMSVIGSSFSQAFYQKSCEIKQNPEQLTQFTYLTYQKLIKISLLPFSILISSSDILFGWLFGKDWIVAGQYVQVLSLWFLFVFISSPLSTLLMILEKQKQNLYFNIIMFVSRIITILIGGIFFADAYSTILSYGIVGFIFWLFFCMYLLRTVRIPMLLVVRVTFFYLLIAIILGFLLRYVMIQLGVSLG